MEIKSSQREVWTRLLKADLHGQCLSRFITQTEWKWSYINVCGSLKLDTVGYKEEKKHREARQWSFALLWHMTTVCCLLIFNSWLVKRQPLLWSDKVSILIYCKYSKAHQTPWYVNENSIKPAAPCFVLSFLPFVVDTVCLNLFGSIPCLRRWRKLKKKKKKSTKWSYKMNITVINK